jgi:hypothetical protein
LLLVAVHIEGVEDNSSLVVASVYRQPNRDIDHTHSLCQDIKEVMNKYIKSTIWIGEDANLPNID